MSLTTLLAAAGLLLSAPPPAPAQDTPPDSVHVDSLSRFVGTVRSRQTGERVSGARVMMPSQGRRTATDQSGRFRLDSLAPGRYEVRVHYLGYMRNPRTVELRPRHDPHLDPGPGTHAARGRARQHVLTVRRRAPRYPASTVTR